METDPTLLGRSNRLRKEFDELRDEMIQELAVVESRMSRPAETAKSYLAPMKKTIKKRNDKKVCGVWVLDGVNYRCTDTNLPLTTLRFTVRI